MQPSAGVGTFPNVVIPAPQPLAPGPGPITVPVSTSLPASNVPTVTPSPNTGRTPVPFGSVAPLGGPSYSPLGAPLGASRPSSAGATFRGRAPIPTVSLVNDHRAGEGLGFGVAHHVGSGVAFNQEVGTGSGQGPSAGLGGPVFGLGAPFLAGGGATDFAPGLGGRAGSG